MSLALIVVLGVLIVMLLIGAPVVFAIGTSALTYFIVRPEMIDRLLVYVEKFYEGMDSFVFLSIPLFILVGELLSQGRMMDQLVRFAEVLVGRFRGGLAHVNLLGSMLFGGVSGSGLSDISALGPIEVRMMSRAGYSREFAGALTATSAIQGPIIPPSIPMVVFAGLTNVSVGALFVGGILPGILIGVVQMIIIFFLARRKNFPRSEQHYGLKDILKASSSAIFALILPVIIIGGILSGVFTPTEAAAVAVGYSLLINLIVFRSVTLLNLKDALVRTVKTTASIYLIIGFATVISWILSMEKVPLLISQLVTAWDLSPYMLLFIVNLFFLFNGMWLSDVAQLLLFAPIFTPIMAGIGIDPVHFGVVMVVNVMISMITPPYGMALYMAAAISDRPLTSIVKESLPFLGGCILVLFLITYFPQIVLLLPELLGAL